MKEILYDYLRIGCGFSLMVVGLGFVVERRRDRPRLALGILFAGVGALFSFSALSPALPLQQDLDLIILVSLVYAISQSFYELCLFIMGGPQDRNHVRKTYTVGAILSVAIVILPLADYVFSWPSDIVGIEDPIPRSPLHAAATILVYLWPISVTIASFVQGKWRLSDIPLSEKPLRHALVFGAFAVPVLSIIAISLVGGHRTFYRLGNILLEFYLILMYLLLVRYPDELAVMRRAIGEEHRRRLSISPDEATEIAVRLERLVTDKRIYLRPGLTIDSLAKELRLPSYRLSKYFGQYLATRFPVWLNSLRIEHVCREMEGDPTRTILTIALDAGFSSKTAFNKQFLERKGMSPSEYRTRRGRSS